MMLRSMTPLEGLRAMDRPEMRPLGRKRKAESQDNNERLSKRLSLLNLEHNGPKLYVPVENLQAPAAAASSTPPTRRRRSTQLDDGSMQVDDTKHKVYIYNLDDELSSESENEDGKLVFLPDIEQHLRANRIPPSVLANKDGELAGMQLVLYNEPSSLSVPREQDSVRKAIIEARARVREKQKEEMETKADTSFTSISEPVQHTIPASMESADSTRPAFTNSTWATSSRDEVDVMDLD